MQLARNAAVTWAVGDTGVPAVRRIAIAYFALLAAGALGGFLVLPFVAAFGTDDMIRWLAAMPPSWGLSWFCGATVALVVAVALRQRQQIIVLLGAIALLVPIATPIFRVWWPLDLVLSVVGILLIVMSWRTLR
jgi:hypothetical protein